jgi:hypothetical protein
MCFKFRNFKLLSFGEEAEEEERDVIEVVQVKSVFRSLFQHCLLRVNAFKTMGISCL